LGVLSTRASRHERAAVEFELVLKLDPTRNHVRIDLAETAMRRGRTEDARELAKAFLAHGLPTKPGTEDPEPGHAAPSERDRAAAEEQYRVILARAAALLSATKEWADAAKVLDLLVDRVPNDAAVWRALARARYESSDVDGGRIASMHVLAIDPSCPLSHHNLGLSALRVGRLEDAASWVKRGLRAARTDEGLRRLRTRVWMARIRRALRLGRHA
jgi:Flp pilus assembly protein TadD